MSQQPLYNQQQQRRRQQLQSLHHYHRPPLKIPNHRLPMDIFILMIVVLVTLLILVSSPKSNVSAFQLLHHLHQQRHYHHHLQRQCYPIRQYLTTYQQCHHGDSCTIMRSSSSSIETESTSSTKISEQDKTSKTIPNEWQGQVLNTLRTIIDPDLNKDIVTLGFIQNLSIQTVTIDSDDVNDTNSTKNIVSFDVELTTPACPIKQQFQNDCEHNVLSLLDWVDEVHVTMTSRDTSSNTINPTINGLSNIASIIAVSSCKGGVGKSTTAVNLAYALQSLGGNVGIFDADIYGPSLPTMITPDNDIVQFIGRQIAPLQRNNVKLMSFGYINDDAAIVRGPIVSQLLDQILSIIYWGSLDYLIIDMPPGTGDIALTISQKLNVTAAVIVTTPQELSYIDVVRGIQMFDSVNVPCIAVVENMAYYEIDSMTNPSISSSLSTTSFKTDTLKSLIYDKLIFNTPLMQRQQLNGDNDSASTTATVTNNELDQLANELVDIVRQQLEQQQQEQTGEQILDADKNNKKERISIFGTGHTQRLSDQFGIEHIYSIPLLSQIANNGDNGTPYILQYPDSEPSTLYKQLAASVVQEVAKIQYNTQRPNIVYNQEQQTIVIDNVRTSDDDSTSTVDDQDNVDAPTEISTKYMSPATLRRACKCAVCVEELTGRQLLVPSTISENIYPKKMYPTGNYALSVDWSDGHRSLYPYRQIKSILQEQRKEKDQVK